MQRPVYGSARQQLRRILRGTSPALLSLCRLGSACPLAACFMHRHLEAWVYEGDGREPIQSLRTALCEAASLRQAFSFLFSLDTRLLRLDGACLTTLFALIQGGAVFG